MIRVLVMCGFLLGPSAMAAGLPNAVQTGHRLSESGAQTVLHVAWKGGGGHADSVHVMLSTVEVEKDKSVKRRVQIADLHGAMAKAARKSAKRQAAVQLKATATRSGVQLQVSGPRKAAKAAMADAQAAMDARRVAWMAENRVFEIEAGALSHDHARVVDERAGALAPLAAALREGTSSDRDFVERALRFSQSIPYQRGRRGGDSGFQRPLALVTRNKGDCDGKSALFLALVRAELPAVPLAMVYVPGHALVGVGLPARKGDRTFKTDGQVFVYAEPVGPAAISLGQTARANKCAGRKGLVRVVPR